MKSDLFCSVTITALMLLEMFQVDCRCRDSISPELTWPSNWVLESHSKITQALKALSSYLLALWRLGVSFIPMITILL